MHRVNLIEMLPTMKEMLDAGGKVTFTVEGGSMLPTMTGGRDSVTLIKPTCPLKKYDISLYRRANGRFVLHRVIGFTETGYIMCGDNQYKKEYGITDAHLIGLVTSFTRNGKEINVNSTGFKIYSVLFCCPVAKFLKHIKSAAIYRIKRLVK